MLSALRPLAVSLLLLLCVPVTHADETVEVMVIEGTVGCSVTLAEGPVPVAATDRCSDSSSALVDFPANATRIDYSLVWDQPVPGVGDLRLDTFPWPDESVAGASPLTGTYGVVGGPGGGWEALVTVRAAQGAVVLTDFTLTFTVYVG